MTNFSEYSNRPQENGTMDSNNWQNSNGNGANRNNEAQPEQSLQTGDSTSSNDHFLQQLANTQQKIKEIIDNIIQTSVIVYDFQGTDMSKEALVEQFNLLTRQLDELAVQSNAKLIDEDGSDTREDDFFPLDVIQYIENGRNPDVYTREFVELAAKQNQYINGKMTAMFQFQNILGDAIKETYPELAPAVDNVKERTKFTGDLSKLGVKTEDSNNNNNGSIPNGNKTSHNGT